jgi:hypothetical protein
VTQHPDPMKEAMAWLDDRDLTYAKKTDYQLKIGKRVSYYPTKGTTFVDRDKAARTRTGLHGLEEVLIELSDLAPEHATPTLASPTLARR